VSVLLVVGCVAASAPGVRTAPAPAPKALIDQYCLGCHSQRLHTGGEPDRDCQKDEYDIAGVFARVTGDGLAHVRLAGPLSEAPCRFVRVIRDDHQTVRMVAASALHRGGELAETFSGIAEKRRVARHGFAQRFLGPGRHGPQMRGCNHACRVAAVRPGRGRQNRMRVGAAEPERIDTGAKQIVRRARAPFDYPGGNGELQRVECDLGIR
jgi:hypothetical protein